MGFEAPETTYGLDFADTKYAGLELAVRAATIGEFLGLQELADTPGGTRKLFAGFAEILVSWNVTRKGKPVPADLDGLLSLEEPFVTAIVLAWQRRVTGVMPPLSKSSDGGGTSPPAGLQVPMTPLPPS